ncbi:unnamed protein product [Adineta steineri]|uniref:YHYH domain-containing protein n=1 Tax=Adineta steineri TaxID=433720 RepID=A0A815XI44_9BILA|nr:unnamed protein product [Adineta steineri]CAF1557315.1 unnamed protein product [Adineta steineri]CAF1558128.1 unnamed protein product [Adineta steineri]
MLGKVALAICAIIFTVFAIAATVVLSLISLYIPNQSVASISAYQTCLTVASKFATTISGPVANITATTGVTVTCSQLTSSSCPGSLVNGICTWQRKLAVTCINGSTVRIRVQSNALPGRCASVPPTTFLKEQNIDFEVNFNPTVNVNSQTHSPTTQSALDDIVCSITNQQYAPSGSNLTSYSSVASLGTVAGMSIDNVPILNVNSAVDVDPFYPPAGYAVETVDTCLAHPQTNGVYHYHMASGCAVSPPTGNLSSCTTTPACSSDIAGYALSTFPSSAKKLTVIGIAKDGHVIYEPYLASGNIVTSGIDICNGMFYDSIGNYAYFATTKYPYVTGCFGPGNYPSFGPSCTTNGQSSYTMSVHAAAQANG